MRVSLAEVLQWVNWKAASGAEASGISPGREGRSSEFQIVPCADGYVAVVYTVTQWPATRTLIGDPRLQRCEVQYPRRSAPAYRRALLDPHAVVPDKTRAEIQSAAQAKGVPFGPIFSPAELLETEQYVARGFLADMEHPAARHAPLPQLPVQWNGRSLSRPRLPPPEGVAAAHERGAHLPETTLTGVRVLDFGLLTAGANTSAMLADLGAEVLKIESGAYLDPFRVVGKPDNDDGWWNRSPQFRFTNRNKRGLALNLKDAEGQRVIRELAAHCDVVVENFRRGVLDRAGLGYAT